MRKSYQRQNFDRTSGKNTRALTITIGVIVLIVAAVGFFGWRWYQGKTKIAGQQDYQANNPQTDLGNQSKRDDAATNTDEQNKMLAETNSPSMSPSSSANLPTPTLTKSSGNNGSVPSGVAIEFTCSAPAGYSCEAVLSGTKTVSLGAKSLATDSRGQTPSVSWMWTSEKGSWSVVAKVSDSKGNVKQSPAQNLEVK